MSDHLDRLLLEYLDAIETYQSLRDSLATRLSTGFLYLAKANYDSASGGRRYGVDFYDGRMNAMRGVEVGHEGVESVLFEPEREEGGQGDADSSSNIEKRTKHTPVVDPRDPIRWFGILVPPALRQAQHVFTRSVETEIPQLSTALSKLAALASQIESHRDHAATRYLYKILLAAPPSPLSETIQPSPLDAASGFIHLCTSTQLLGVIESFMPDSERLWLLKIPYGRVEKVIKWESVGGEWGGESFPHMFAEGLRAGEVEDLREVPRLGGWREALEGMKWLED